MNEYFQTGAVPAPSSPGASSVMRQEFANIAAGFDKLPVLSGHQGEIVFVDATGSRLETNGTAVTDFVTLTGAQTVINKTIAWGNNTFPGFGTGATKNAGAGAGEVPVLIGAAKLPALDGSLLTNLNINQAGTIVDIAHGGTGAATVESAQIALGINLKADANNAVLSGAPTAPNPPTGNDSARIATTHFVQETVTAIGAFGPGAASPQMNGAASAGVSTLGSREDHVHPVDTSRAAAAAATAAGTSFTPAGNIAATNVQSALQELDGEVYAALVVLDNQKADLASPTFTGDPKAPTPTAGDNDTSIATTAFVQTAIAPLAPLASPTFTGDPKAPTPLTSDNDTSIATTAFVQSLLAQQPPGVQVSNSTPLINGVAAPGTGVEASRYDHVHPASNAAGTSFTPAGNIAATNVQTAIQELDSEKVGNTGSQTMAGPLIVTDKSGSLRGYRNFLINGGFRVNQRGTVGVIANGIYGPDRWIAGITGGTGITANTATSALTGTTYGIGGYIQGTWTTGKPFFAQRLEANDSKALNGKTITISGKCYQDTGSAMTLECLLHKPNVADTWGASTLVATNSSVASIPNATVTPFSVTFALGASDATTGLQVYIGAANAISAASKSFYLSDVQLEIGSVATEFEHVPIQADMTACFRYLQRVDYLGMTQYNIAGNGWEQTHFLPHVMRTTPTPTGYAFTTSNVTGSVIVTAPTPTVISFTGGTATASGAMIITLSGTLFLSAEL